MNAFEYRAPGALDEALAVLREHGEDARAVAGGTALVTMLRQHLVRPGCLVSLRDVPLTMRRITRVTIAAPSL